MAQQPAQPVDPTCTGSSDLIALVKASGRLIQQEPGHIAVVERVDGEPGGEYVVAARINRDGSVPALEPTGRDAAGTAAALRARGRATGAPDTGC